MHLPIPLSSEVSVSDLLLQIQTLLEKVERQAVQIEKLTAENTKLHAEIRHLKKLKGKPNIRPQKKDSDSDDEGNTALGSDNSPPPKSKRTRQQKPGGTSIPVAFQAAPLLAAFAHPDHLLLRRLLLTTFLTLLSIHSILGDNGASLTCRLGAT